ncbi:MAG: lysylphosphatidylglycerol synthase transmembrane domain-containing protein [Bacteroidota bacterium]
MARKLGPLSKVKTTNIIYPIIIGLGVVGYMFFKEFNPAAFSVLQFTKKTLIWIFIALLLMVIRDVGYIIRIRILTDQKLSWIQSIRVILLWEFTSAITPSAIGGTSIAILYVNKENISVGKSSAVVMATSFLDELYFIIFFPVLLLIAGAADLFGANSPEIRNEFMYFAIIGYSLKLLYTLIVSYGLFINPRGLKWLLLWIFKLPILRRWRTGANETGTELVSSSAELKSKSLAFWLKAFGATIISWTARYWVANALLVAFFIVPNHFLVFARQFVMWIMMLVSPTPGGSGFAEFIFTEYLGEFIPVAPEFKAGVAVAIAFFWRLISYYPYLVIGVFIFPRWIKMKFVRKKESLG